MSYLENRSEEVKALHNIYISNKEIPEYLKELIDVPEIMRLSGVDQNSGIHLTGFDTIEYQYSVLDHSLGIALILENFTTNKNQVIAAFLHDIAVPAFADSAYHIDEKNFNADDTALSVYDAIVGSDKLFNYFIKNDISIDEICDYTVYPLAYNVSPHLCAYRLENLLHHLFLNHMCSESEIEELYQNLVVAPNEENIPEFCFMDERKAEKFCILSLDSFHDFRSYESKAAIQFISETLAAMVRREVISRKDLYQFSDRVIMEMGVSCSDKRISDRWKYLPSLNKVYTKFNEVEGKHCYKFDSDLEYVNPLMRLESGEYIRASNRFPICIEKINTYLNSDTDLYFYMDYED
ncbi:MAG: hypothetical protein IJ215_04935 [Clostridia bacterium]|nr:hypothetical protein [Clostridia bacterium]